MTNRIRILFAPDAIETATENETPDLTTTDFIKEKVQIREGGGLTTSMTMAAHRDLSRLSTANRLRASGWTVNEYIKLLTT